MSKANKTFEDRLAALASEARQTAAASVSPDTGQSATAPRNITSPKPKRMNAAIFILPALGLTLAITAGIFSDRILAKVTEVRQAAAVLVEKQTVYVTPAQAEASRPKSAFANAPKPPTGFAAAIQRKQSENFAKNFDPEDWTEEGMQRRQERLQKLSDKLGGW